MIATIPGLLSHARLELPEFVRNTILFPVVPSNKKLGNPFDRLIAEVRASKGEEWLVTTKNKKLRVETRNLGYLLEQQRLGSLHVVLGAEKLIVGTWKTNEKQFECITSFIYENIEDPRLFTTLEFGIYENKTRLYSAMPLGELIREDYESLIDFRCNAVNVYV